jgi:hypothetical protein
MGRFDRRESDLVKITVETGGWTFTMDDKFLIIKGGHDQALWLSLDQNTPDASNLHVFARGWVCAKTGTNIW